MPAQQMVVNSNFCRRDYRPPSDDRATVHRARDPFNIDRRVDARRLEAAPQLLRWAPGYDGTLDAALALLHRLQQLAQVPQPVAERIRALATLSSPSQPPR